MWEDILKNQTSIAGVSMRSMDLDNIIEEEDDNCRKRLQKLLDSTEALNRKIKTQLDVLTIELLERKYKSDDGQSLYYKVVDRGDGEYTIYAINEQDRIVDRFGFRAHAEVSDRFDFDELTDEECCKVLEKVKQSALQKKSNRPAERDIANDLTISVTYSDFNDDELAPRYEQGKYSSDILDFQLTVKIFSNERSIYGYAFGVGMGEGGWPYDYETYRDASKAYLEIYRKLKPLYENWLREIP